MIKKTKTGPKGKTRTLTGNQRKTVHIKPYPSSRANSSVKTPDISFFRSFDASPSASALVSAKSGKYLDVNRKFLLLFECTRDEVIGKTPDQLGFWFDKTERKKILGDFRKNASGKNYIFRIRTKKGRIKDVLVSTETIIVKGEKCYLGHLLDISESRKASNEIKKSEEKYRALLENSRDVIFNFDIKKGKYVYVSPSSKDILGIEPNEFIVQKYGVLASRLHKDDRKRINKHFRDIFTLKGKKKKSFFIEYRFLFNKSEYKWIADNHTVVYDSQGRPESLVGNISDVTFRKEAQEQLIKSYELQKGYLELLSSLQNALPAHIAMLDKKGNIIAVNDSWRKYSYKNSLIHNDFREGMDYIRICRSCKGEIAAEGKAAAEGIRNVLTGKAGEFQIEYPFRTGTEHRWLRQIVTPISKHKNEGAVVMHIDVTDRKHAELALKESEAQLRQLFEEDLTGNYIAGIDGKVLICNPAFAKIIGYKDVKEVRNSRKFRIFSSDFGNTKFVSLLEKKQRIPVHEREITKHDGSKITILENIVGNYDKGGRLVNIQGYLMDISGIKKAEQALKLSEEQYKLLFYDNPLPMWVFDYNTLRIIAVNEESILWYGYSKKEFLKMKVTDLIHPDDRKRYLEYRKDSGGDDTSISARNVGTWKHVTKKGSIIDIEVTRRAIVFEGRKAILVLAKDITERIKALESLKKRNQEISLLYEAEKELTSSLDPAKIYDKIFSIISEILPCSSMVISSYDREKNTISCIAAWLAGKKLDTSFFPVLNFDKTGKGIQSNAIITGRSRLIEDFERISSKNKRNYYVYKNGKVKRSLGKKDLVNRSLLIVPMKFGSRVIGLLQVSSYVDKAYTENDLKILEALSTQLSAATANARLYQQAQIEIAEKEKAQKTLRTRTDELVLLYESSKELSNTLEIDSIYERIYRMVSLLMPCSGMGISSFDEKEKIISAQVIWQNGLKQDTCGIPPIKYDEKGEGLQSRVIKTRKSVFINDYDKYIRERQTVYYIKDDSSISRKREKKFEIAKSALLVPLITEDKVIGVIQILSAEENAFNENNLRILEALSSQAAAAMTNARLYKTAQHEIEEKEFARKKLKERTEEVTLLYEMAKELSSTLEPGAIYTKVYENLSKMIPFDSMAIANYDQTRSILKYMFIWDGKKKYDTGSIPEIPISKDSRGVNSVAINTGEPILENNYEERVLKDSSKAYYINNEGKLKDAKKTGLNSGKNETISSSAIIVPLKSEGSVIGVINVFSNMKNAFTEEHMHQLESVAVQVSAATTNARLYQRAQTEISEKEKVQEELQRKTEELSVLYEAQREISNTLDPNIVFDNIYKSVSAIMPCDSMIISSFKKEEMKIKVLAIWADGVKPSIKDYPGLPLAPEGFGIQSQVIRSGQSRLILDYEEQFKKSLNNYSYNDDEISGKARSLYSSALLVPMKLEGNVIGTLQVLSYKKNAFNGDNLRMLESLTAPITAATVNAGLYQQAQTELAEKHKAEEALRKKNEEIMILYEAERELSGSLDIENIYDVLYGNISRIISCGSMIISGYDINTNEVTCKAAWVESTKHDPKKFPVLKLTGELGGTQGEAIRTKRSLIVNNFYEIVQKSKEKFYIDEEGNILDYEKENEQIDDDAQVTKSAMFVPMMLGEKVIGVISVFSFEENAYSDYHLRMLESLSTQVAAVTANAELYARAQNEIDERIKKEIELKEIRRNMEEAQRIAHIGNWVLNTQTNEIYNSAEIYNILGLDVITTSVPFGQLLGSIHDEDRDLTHKLINKAILEKKSYINEDRIVKPDGEIRFVRIMGEPVIDENGNLTAMQGTMQDITDLKRINDELMKSLSEKELMLKEIHHRVKNNLQVVSSLLRLQSEKIKDKATVEYFKLSEQRVKSMALIHQQLYKTKDLSMINFREYLKELCSYLFFMNGISANTIKLNINVEEIYFGIDTALPCGLIINELVTNSIKHAFPGGRKGSISISLLENKETGNELIVKDDGIGAGKLDFKNSTTLGMELVDTLTEQLDGRLEVNTDSGTEIKIIFKELYYKKRI